MPKSKREDDNSSSSSCAKLKRLSIVLTKAIDASIQSIGTSEVNACFGENLSSKYSNRLEGAVVKALGRTQHLIENRFQEMIESMDLNKKLSNLEKAKVLESDVTTISPDDVLSSTILDIQNLEAGNIRNAIDDIEKDIFLKKTKIDTFKSQIEDQLTALQDENDKIQLTADKFK